MGPEEERVYNKALRFATLRPRSEQEIELWFKRKKVYPERSRRVFNRLKKLGLIDDAFFAKWWIDQRVSFRPKPRKVLRLELLQKGVGRDEIEAAFRDIEMPSEQELANTIAVKALGKFRTYPKLQREKKLIQFLLRRGFDWEVVKKVVDSLKE